MKSKRVALTAVIGLCLLAGCDDRGKSLSSSSRRDNAAPTELTGNAPATEPSPAITASEHSLAEGPATRPAEPPHSTFFVGNGQTPQPLAYNFPRARLRIDRDDKSAILYSDDPKSAIDSKYVGNGYYMRIPLTDDALSHLNGYQWHYKAISSEHQDTPDGIFLEGQRYHLQPQDITVTFSGEAPVVSVAVEGSFYQFDMSQNIREGILAPVKGMVTAVVDVAK